MRLTRREVLHSIACASAAPALVRRCLAQETPSSIPIIDTHQHLWDLERLRLPWLDGAPEVLRRSYGLEDYRQATEGLDVRTVYMEVDVAPTHKQREAEDVLALCARPDSRMLGAVIGGDPSHPGFPDYVRRFAGSRHVKGVRQVLHNDDIPAGYCLRDEFVRGVQLLGERGLRFDLCLRPRELADGRTLAEKCPDTRFILDHCGNADPKAFGRPAAGGEPPSHDADGWRRDIDRLAERPNVLCKISGIIARAPDGWTADSLAPIVNHCLDAFGPDRVVFGGDWPVCLLGGPLRAWVDALHSIVAERPQAEQRKLWSDNALREYELA